LVIEIKKEKITRSVIIAPSRTRAGANDDFAQAEPERSERQTLVDAVETERSAIVGLVRRRNIHSTIAMSLIASAKLLESETLSGGRACIGDGLTDYLIS
jgi:hypothetical protein